jgi:hypothetical protein
VEILEGEPDPLQNLGKHNLSKVLRTKISANLQKNHIWRGSGSELNFSTPSHRFFAISVIKELKFCLSLDHCHVSLLNYLKTGILVLKTIEHDVCKSFGEVPASSQVLVIRPNSEDQMHISGPMHFINMVSLVLLSVLQKSGGGATS